MQGILRESNKAKKRGDFSLFIEFKVFFESEFVGFEVYCILLYRDFSSKGNIFYHFLFCPVFYTINDAVFVKRIGETYGLLGPVLK